MTRIRVFALTVLAATIVVTGCGDDTLTPPGGSGDAQAFSAEEMADVTLASDALTEAIIDFQIDNASAPALEPQAESEGQVTKDVTFSMTRPCEKGGEIRVNSELQLTYTPDTRVLEAEFQGTREREDCAFPQGPFKVTVNSSELLEASRRRVAGVPDGPQRTFYEGSLHAVRSDGLEQMCEFRLEIIRDPVASSRTLTGTICGTDVRRTVGWSMQG